MSDKPTDAAVWKQGEGLAVGMAFAVGFFVAALALGRFGWGIGGACALWGLTWFTLWYVLALMQVFTRTLLTSAAALALAIQGTWETKDDEQSD